MLYLLFWLIQGVGAVPIGSHMYNQWMLPHAPTCLKIKKPNTARMLLVFRVHHLRNGRQLRVDVMNNLLRKQATTIDNCLLSNGRSEEKAFWPHVTSK
jgi:hypothetical protein